MSNELEEKRSETMQDDVLPGVPDTVKLKLADLVSHLDKVESIITQIESKSINQLHPGLSQLEVAKLNWISMYAINSLFFVYLKNTGITLKDHPLMTELNRIRNYMTRIKEIEDAEKHKNTLRIDKESSARIIKRSLWMHASKKKHESTNPPNDEHDEDENTQSIKRINLNS